jgi:hypothetical protein
MCHIVTYVRIVLTIICIAGTVVNSKRSVGRSYVLPHALHNLGAPDLVYNCRNVIPAIYRF